MFWFLEIRKRYFIFQTFSNNILCFCLPHTCSGALEEASLVQEDPQNTRPGHRVNGLASLPERGHVLDSGPQWEASIAQVHARTSALRGNHLGYVLKLIFLDVKKIYMYV